MREGDNIFEGRWNEFGSARCRYCYLLIPRLRLLSAGQQEVMLDEDEDEDAEEPLSLF